MSLLAAALFTLMLREPDVMITDLKRGKGPEIALGDVATVTYKGMLADGKIFDESKDKPPFVFRLDGKSVIPGFEKGVFGMKKGGKRKVVIPPELAYGEKGIEDVIPGNATLTFEFRLLRIDAKGAKPMIEIEEVTPGEGPEAKEGDTIEVHYIGTFLDGKKFDSSRDRDEPLTVIIGKTGLIKGFTQGVTGMKLGQRRKVTIPYDLAYGEAGRPPTIPKMSTLVFDLEIMKLTPGN